MLRGRGINPTRQRIEIALALFSRMTHMSAEQIRAVVNQSRANASKATVYNTLRLFVGHKLIREVIVDPSRVFYDPNTAPHYHIYDIDSGDLRDIPIDGIRLSGLPALPRGVVAEGIDIILRVRSSA